MIQEVEIKNWRDLLNKIDRFDVGPPTHINYLFRGQSNSSWKLTSSFHRYFEHHNIEPRKLIDLEEVALYEFKSVAHKFLSPNIFNSTNNILDWWVIMQHHRAPTRLLDWTTSPYVAAYFACAEHFDKPGAIWVIHSRSLAEEMLKQHDFESLPINVDNFFHSIDALPIVTLIDSKVKTERMVIQQGVFSVCGNIKVQQHQVFVETLNNTPEKTTFIKLTIPAKLKSIFLKKLRSMNVMPSTLFPGIDGLGRSISELVTLGILHETNKLDSEQQS